MNAPANDMGHAVEEVDSLRLESVRSQREFEQCRLRIGELEQRIAAIDQLKKYADIIDSALRVVNTPDELREAIDAML